MARSGEVKPRFGIHRRPRPLRQVLAGVGALTVLVGGLVAALVWSLGGPGDSRSTPDLATSDPQSTERPRSTESAEPAEPAEPAVPAVRAASDVRPERPEIARLPSGALIPIRAVSTRADGRLDVPDDISTAGWWRGGSRLGDPFGSTLLAAHIDSTTQGLGPYVELLSVQPGQRIVLMSATLEQPFEIRSLRLVPQGSLDGERWIFSARGARRLTLVTCAPPYDASRGGYQNLAIVTATAMADPTERTD